MAKSILEQYHFTEGEKLKGGFPIRILLEEDQEKKNLIGGGLVESIGMDKFNDYAIPIGLVSFQDRQFKLTEKKSSRREPEVINDDLFDKLFMAVSKQRKYNNSNKTKKKGATGSF